MQQIGTHLLTEARQPVGSSSKAQRGEFRITNSYTLLTQGHTAWEWGLPAPSPINSGEEDLPGGAGEVKCSAHMLAYVLTIALG